jgi:hypothetical protein
MILRTLKTRILADLDNYNKIQVIYGPRQVGKTTLVNLILGEMNGTVMKANGDDMRYHEVFSSRNFDKMKDFVGDRDILFIDEAHMIPEIGINLKILYDQMPHLKIIVTGSSSLDLASTIKEPLTGRTVSYHLFSISLKELSARHTNFELQDKLNDWLLYGTYPEIINIEHVTQKISRLREIASSYLYRDILMVANIRNNDKIYKLLQLLSYQIGQTVSINELATKLSLSSDAVNNYITLLEQSFIIFRLSGWNSNPRKEVSKMNKVYFYDLGIRNTIIDDFRPIEDRMDRGQLFENFIIVERMKRNSYNQSYARYYYWRTYGGAEVDYIESYDNTLYGFEIKYNQKLAKAPKSWIEAHSSTSFETININNYLPFLDVQ